MKLNRWSILAVLFLARFALGFQFQSAGSVTPFILNEFAIGYADLGTLVGLFMVPGLVLTVPSGFIGRRLGDKHVVSIGLALMIAGGALSGLTDSYMLVVIGRLISGVGAAFLFVLMTKMLADWFADKELFFGMSVFIIGWPIGIACGQAIQSSIADATSWHVVFHMTAVVALVAFLAIVAFYRPPPDGAEANEGSYTALSRHELALVTIAGLAWMFVNGAYLVLLSFGPIFLQESGYSFSEAARVVSLMSWVFLFSLPVGGFIASRFKVPNLVMFPGLIGTVVVGLLIAYTDVPLATFAAFGILYAGSVPIVASLPAKVLKAQNRGPGFGIYYIWYFVGSAFLPVVAGYLKDLTGAATSTIVFSAIMMLATVLLTGLFRLAQWRGRSLAAAPS